MKTNRDKNFKDRFLRKVADLAYRHGGLAEMRVALDAAIDRLMNPALKGV
jgi:hypothetical protein